MKELIRILFTIFRYPASVVVAFVVSILVAIKFPDIFPEWRSGSPFWNLSWFFCIGLAGVGMGSICLPCAHRLIGSLCLLVLGLGFTICFFGDLGSDTPFFSLLLPLAVGGSIPVLVYCLPRLKSGSNLTNKEVMTLVVAEACLATAMFLLSFLFQTH